MEFEPRVLFADAMLVVLRIVSAEKRERAFADLPVHVFRVRSSSDVTENRYVIPKPIAPERG